MTKAAVTILMKSPVEFINFAIRFLNVLESMEGESIPASLIHRQGERAESRASGQGNGRAWSLKRTLVEERDGSLGSLPRS